jgi:thiamine kinase-like enzyme
MTVRPAPDALAAPSARTSPEHALQRLLGAAADGAELSPLLGGLTNDNYRVALADGREAVLRIPTASDEALGIDRAAELRNARAAAACGVAPAVLAADESGQSLVTWIDGVTLTSGDLDDSAMLRRVAATCRDLHAGSRFASDFDMPAVQRRYLRAVGRRGIALPAGYHDHAAAADRIAAALRVDRVATVPCHNDLLAANILDDGRVWFIDWEYSGNNDPAFELGNLWSEADLPEARLAELVGYYYDREDPRLVARARLHAGLAQYGWTLWGLIQHAVSAVDFDFTAWALHRYERAVALFRSPALGTLLDTLLDTDSDHRVR